MLESFRPYSDGDSLLYSVSEMANTNKHALLVPIGGTFGGMFIERLSISMNKPFGVGEPAKWDRRTSELIFLRTPSDSMLDFKMEMKVCAGFAAEVAVVCMLPVTPTLRQIADRVQNVLTVLEREARSRCPNCLSN